MNSNTALQNVIATFIFIKQNDYLRQREISHKSGLQTPTCSPEILVIGINWWVNVRT